MVRVLLLTVMLGWLSFGMAELRAENAPAPVCDCSKMIVSVRDASGRAVTSGVQMKNFAFAASTITISAGDTITWTNTDNSSHTATSDTGAFDTGTLSMGGSKSITFNTPGTYPYHCEFHNFMTGSITVLAATAPVLTNLTATGFVNVPFSYTLTATGTAPISYAATLPAGFTLNGAVITGTFSVGGNYSIPVSATNAQGTDNKFLAVTVASSGGPDGDISGTYIGTLKGKHFDQEAKSAKPDSVPFTLVVLQTGKTLTTTLTIAGASPAFAAAGQFGNKNLWLLGTSNTDNIALSAHLDKKGTAITGTGIRYNPAGDVEFTFSAKKQ